MTTATKLIVPEQKVSEFPPPAPRQSDAAAFLSVIERAARDESVDIDKMERLWKMRQQMLEEEAKREFNRAMAAAQAEMGPVTRDKKNEQTNSMYAQLEAIDEVIRPIYTKHGFALSFDQGTTLLEGHVRILCDVSHAGGHTIPKHWDLPLDSVGMKGNPNKTLVHANGSTISYGRRYLTCMVFNIVLKNEDKDGNQKKEQPKISLEQINELEKLIIEVGADRTKFMRYLKVEALGDIFAARMDDVKKLLEAKRKAKKEPQK